MTLLVSTEAQTVADASDEGTPPDRWARLKEVFQAALDQPVGKREQWVRETARGEPEIIEGVLELLASEDAGTLDLGDSQDDPVIPAAALFSGLEQVGPYRIERELARGGMGRVFRATRENPRRAAAVKLMTRALHDTNAIRRFEYESQILAELSHPNIAHVYESGTVEYIGETIPWYAMELVEEGRPLDAVFPELGADTARGVELLLQVCDGVHHAHQRGVIHRDLKPSNVLVDPGGRVKVIDFGIAKFLSADQAPGATDLTAAGDVMGTLAYMSPEQVSGKTGALDVRVDVYALGVIMYRVLTGKMPYELNRERLREAATTICETPPDPGHLDRAGIPTDLRLIVLKALSKRASERYDSVAALSADLRRYARAEPIEARPPSLVYQLSRFAARNRGLVASLAAVFVALAAGATLSTYGLLEAREARDRSEEARAEAERQKEEAERARDSAEKAREFATEILAEADPWESQEPDITLRKVLERASKRLEGEREVDPRTEVLARQTLRRVFDHLGEHELAERETRRALALAQDDPTLQDEHLELLSALGATLLSADRIDEAEPVINEALERHVAAYGEDDDRTLAVRSMVAGVLKGRGQMNEARDAYVALVEQMRTSLGERDELTIDTLSHLGNLQHAMGELSAAEASFREVWEAREAAKGARHPTTLMAHQELVSVIVDHGRLEEAEEELAALVAAFTDVLGARHSATGGSMALHGLVLRRLGRPREALPLAEEVLAISTALNGPEHVHTLRAKNNLAMVLADAGEWDRAEGVYIELGKTWADRDADAEGSYIVVAINHAQLLDKRERAKDGVGVLDAAIARAAEDYPKEFWLVEFAGVHRARLEGIEIDPNSLESERARALAGLPAKRGPG